MNEGPKMVRRSFYYSLDLIYNSSPYSYHSIPKVIMINILNSNLFNSTDKEKNKLCRQYTLIDNDTNEKKYLKDLISIHIIQLLKYKEHRKKHNNELRRDDPWILFLNNPNDDLLSKKSHQKYLLMQGKS